jgi:hypothetical protein
MTDCDAQKTKTRGGTGALAARVIPLLAVFLALSPVRAQEALRYSLAGELAARTQKSKEEIPYNIKLGPMSMQFEASTVVMASDNINAADVGREADVSFRPTIEVNTLWPVTPLNTLVLKLGVGYTKYVSHSEYDSLYIQPGSSLSFDVFVKDFKITFHDQFSYLQDPLQRADVAGGTNGAGNFGIAQNTVGVKVDWDLNRMLLSAGYGHANYFALSEANKNIDRSSELVSLRGVSLGSEQLSVGMEATAAFTRYSEPGNNDNQQYSIGPFVEWQVSQFIRMAFRGGYLLSSFDNTSTNTNFVAETSSSYYLGLGFDHQLNQFIKHSLSFDRSTQLGINSDLVEIFTVRHSATWNIINNIGLSTSLSYEDGKSSGVTVPEKFNRFTASLGLGYRVTQKLTTSLNYAYSIRHSDQAFRGYYQNVLTLNAGYSF